MLAITTNELTFLTIDQRNVVYKDSNSAQWNSKFASGAVLLAAHCLFGGSINKPVWYPPEWVEFNRHDLFDDNAVVRVYLKDTQQCNGNAIYHPDYDHETGTNDVAILFLPHPITNYTCSVECQSECTC